MIYIFRNHIISDCLTPGRDFNQTLAVFLLFFSQFMTHWYFYEIIKIHPVVRLLQIQLLQRHFGLTLHNHINFISGRNGELWMNILTCIALKMQRFSYDVILNTWGFYCCCYFTSISLVFIVITEWTFSQWKPLCTQGLTWYTLKATIMILMKCIWRNWHVNLRLLSGRKHPRHANNVIWWYNFLCVKYHWN